MLPCRNLLSSFAILATALFFVAPVGIVAQSSQATCLPPYGWMTNGKGQSPCLVAAYLISVCDVAPFVVQPLPPTYHYIGPYAGGQSTCACSTITYSAFSACAICQNATETNWSLWSFNCSTVYPGSYPPGIPSGTAVPHWMFQDVATTNVFNAALAQSAGDLPESTASQAQSSVSNSATATGTSASLTAEPIGTAAGTSASLTAEPTATSTQTSTPAPSGGGPKIGAIVGGVVGGVVGLLAIVGLAAFFILKNKKPSQAQALMAEDIPSAIYTDGTSLGLSDVVKP
ncbi:hypothetical protein JVT61DRAFT_15120 [Boletus reticuloceps]|uniref:Uncharacterized protein n=1 Tax=Boletus reticuloceps TaxID=495285 RepID=A0A8I3ACI3_9AGAM|nr:hypothetical protein JVT61DRAFT_15120 [Boletus reticuloceps]